MALAVVREDRLSIVQAEAVAALERAKGNRAQAAQILEVEAKKSPSLLRAITESTLADLCYRAIRSAELRVKPNTLSALKLWSNPNSKEAAEIRLREADRLSSLYFWTLPNGQPLGTATRPDLGSAILHIGKLERGNRATRLWLEAIFARLKGDQTVEKALTEKKLAQLREEADSKAAVD